MDVWLSGATSDTARLGNSVGVELTVSWTDFYVCTVFTLNHPVSLFFLYFVSADKQTTGTSLERRKYVVFCCCHKLVCYYYLTLRLLNFQIVYSTYKRHRYISSPADARDHMNLRLLLVCSGLIYLNLNFSNGDSHASSSVLLY